jgi:hypothetical protein
MLCRNLSAYGEAEAVLYAFDTRHRRRAPVSVGGCMILTHLLRSKNFNYSKLVYPTFDSIANTPEQWTLMNPVNRVNPDIPCEVLEEKKALDYGPA